jgi:anti-sigma regulatory factor (Ser/Thr protein kinase)
MVGFVSRADDVELALSEVLANAQEHGRVPISVSAWFDGRFLVEVRDHGRGFDRTRIWASHPPTPLGLRGRGLWIARQITDGVTVRSGGDGTTVTIEFCREPQLGA